MHAQLPNRLVDHFCVVDYTLKLSTTVMHNVVINGQINSPEDVLLTPIVKDCYPTRNSHRDMEFPEHLSTFVCPEGYQPSSVPLPPTFFTFILTCADGNRLYGGVLRIHDQSYDMDILRTAFEATGCPSPAFLGGGGIVYLPKYLVVLSHYPFFDLWRKFLLVWFVFVSWHGCIYVTLVLQSYLFCLSGRPFTGSSSLKHLCQ
jgi:hypothetical protein